MKVVTLPIECIAWFDENGKSTPFEKLAGNYMYAFDCQSGFGE